MDLYRLECSRQDVLTLLNDDLAWTKSLFTEGEVRVWAHWTKSAVLPAY